MSNGLNEIGAPSASQLKTATDPLSETCYNIRQGTEFRKSVTSSAVHHRSHTIPEAVSPRLPNDTARIRSLVKSYGIWSGHSGRVVGVFQLLRFVIPPVLHTHLSSGAGTIGPLVASIPYHGHYALELNINYSWKSANEFRYITYPSTSLFDLILSATLNTCIALLNVSYCQFAMRFASSSGVWLSYLASHCIYRNKLSTD
jgi:hypothetical protein